MDTSTQVRSFGHLPTGEAVELWRLEGAGGFAVEAMTYGCTVTRLLVPDRDGRTDDVVLGHAELSSYQANPAYFGATIGRVAGRCGSEFSVNGHNYALAANDPPNHLHGGRQGFDKQVWKAEPLSTSDRLTGVRFRHYSPDGHEGYPGAVEVLVTFRVLDGTTFQIDTAATSDRTTPLNMTHHSYFNLNGESSGSTEDHELQVFADAFVPTDERGTLLARRVPVADQTCDFRRPRRLGDVVPHLPRHHGELYYLHGRMSCAGGLRTAARLHAPACGRLLTVSTTEDYLQFYSGVALQGLPAGKSRRMYEPYAGICLECEGYPDGMLHPELGDILLRPGRTFRTTTAYTFSIA